jgi:hypothetical protein
MLLAGSDPTFIDPPNLPPEWIATPAPSWQESEGGTYNLDNLVFDPEDTVTYTLNAGSASLPTGVTLASNGVLTATTAVSEGTTTGIIVDADDGVNSAVASSSFSITILGAVSEATLRTAGYLLPEDYGAVADDSTPSVAATNTDAINDCIEDGWQNYKPIWFQGGKTYYVDDTIQVRQFPQNSGLNPNQVGNHLQGGGGTGTGLSKATIRLIDSATGFGSAGTPRPVLCCRWFSTWPKQTGVYPSDPLETSSPWLGKASNYFNLALGNLHIHCGSSNAGAFGVYAPAAQECWSWDMEITATGALGGWWGLLGRQAAIINLKVTGGTWMIKNDKRSGSGWSEGNAGSIIAGLTLVGEAATTVPIENDDFVPLTIVGFDIDVSASTVPVFTIGSTSLIEQDIICMIDGKIDTGGGPVFDNDNGKTCYLRNVEITGTNTLITDPTGDVTTTGTWSTINEYAYQDGSQSGYTDPQTGGSHTRSFATLINGTKSPTSQGRCFSPDTSNDTGTPSVDYIARHTITVEAIDQGAYLDVVQDHGAVPRTDEFDRTLWNTGATFTGATDNRAAIQAAIDAAETAGHNRVFVPRGVFHIGSPGLTMKRDTKLFGTGMWNTTIGNHADWNPTSQVWLITTDDDANGTAHFSNITPGVEQQAGNLTDNKYTNQFFSPIKWRVGRNSSSVQPQQNHQFVNASIDTNIMHLHHISSSGGGKHYAFNTNWGSNTAGTDATRYCYINGTSEPLHIYGLNPEWPKDTPSTIDVNVEIRDSSNIRIYSSKREGDAATIWIDDCTNIAWYGMGRQTTDDQDYVILVDGVSDKILFAPVVHDNTTDQAAGPSPATLRQTITGQSDVQIDYADEMVGYYRYGTMDDASVAID